MASNKFSFEVWNKKFIVLSHVQGIKGFCYFMLNPIFVFDLVNFRVQTITLLDLVFPVGKTQAINREDAAAQSSKHKKNPPPVVALCFLLYAQKYLRAYISVCGC